MRRPNARIQVKLKDRYPHTFTWRGQTHRVIRILDRWRYMGRWWAGEGEWRCYRVETVDGGEFELHWYEASGEWRLWRIYD